MLSLLAPALLALTPSADAGELHVIAPPRATVAINGRVAPVAADGVLRASPWLVEGDHLIEVYDRRGALRHRSWVNVPADARITFTADRYSLYQSDYAWLNVEPQRPRGQARGHRAPAQPAVVVIDTGPQRPARPPAQRGPQIIPADTFGGLLGAIHAEPFGDDKLAILATASGSWAFTIEQVGALMDAMTFSDEKVEVARMLRSQVVDPENAWALAGHLTFSSDKQEVARLYA